MSFPAPTEKQARVLWISLTALALGILLALLGLLLWGVGWVINRLSTVLLPLAVAGIIACLLDPVVDFFVRHRVPRARAILLVFFLAVMLVLALLGTVVPRLIVETDQLIRRLPEYSRQLQLKVDEWISKTPFATRFLGDWRLGTNPTNAPASPLLTNAFALPTASPTNQTNQVSATGGGSRTVLETEAGQAMLAWATANLPRAGHWLAQRLSQVASWFGLVAGLALVPVYAFYFLLEKSGIEKNWTGYLPLRESRAKEELVFVLRAINDCLIVFFRSQVLVALCVGTLLAIGFSILGLNYAVLLGAIAGLLGIVPYLGVMISLIPALAIAIIQFGDPWHPLLVLLIFGVVQALEGLVISPKIIGDRVGLHPLTIIIAVMVGTTLLGGILGGVLAIPLTAALRTLMFRYVWKKRPG